MNKTSNWFWLIVCLASIVLQSCSILRSRLDHSPEEIKTDSTAKKAKLHPYDKVITKEAISQQGLFTVHQVEGKYYFEIPDSLLGREMLVVTRFVKTPTGAPKYGGEEVSEHTVIWEKAPNNKMLLRAVAFINRVDDEDAIAQAVKLSNASPIAAAFDIKAIHADSNSSVIEVTDFINSDNPLLALSASQKGMFNLTSLEKDKSYIERITTYPINTEVHTVKTYKAKASSDRDKSLLAATLSGVVTLEINNSILLLPKVPMEKRYFDPRVGYFASAYFEYGDDQQRVDRRAVIHRWRLEPKPEDREKWLRGELVEPAKPIVFYIDPATPDKWRPYLIQGINDWQVAFEQAGFKNAIIGKHWPESDSTMSLEDARFSVIRYFASPMRNAYGPNVADPRSGEILESHIGWYHNVMNLVHNWYLIQAGAVDPRARHMTFSDDLMGELIRFVSSHEVGHTLGLRHNMAASYATPVAKLRDSAWLAKYGHTSSIMDYARFNYVAQPEDGVSPEHLMPRINDYDKWAIQWGYTRFRDTLTDTEKRTRLSQWITDSVSTNPRLRFGGEGRDFDPRSQTEDLGDNAMEASRYGIKNLKRIVPELIHWSNEHPWEGYENLEEIYGAAVGQYKRYIDHVVKNIGGIYITPKSIEEPGAIYAYVDIHHQKAALDFLDTYLFHKPAWLLDTAILNRIQSPTSKNEITKMVESTMLTLLGASRISRMGFIADRTTADQRYDAATYLADVHERVWKELKNRQAVSAYRRHLQKNYVSHIITLYKPAKASNSLQNLMAQLGETYTVDTDTRALALSDLLDLQAAMKRAIPSTHDEPTLAHYRYLVRKIEAAIQE